MTLAMAESHLDVLVVVSEYWACLPGSLLASAIITNNLWCSQYIRIVFKNMTSEAMYHMA